MLWEREDQNDYIADIGPAEMAKRLTSGHEVYSRAPYQIPPHIELLQSAALSALNSNKQSNEPKNLIVSMPPRHGKSEYISYYLPIWFAARHPGSRIILVGYSMEFTSGFGKRIQDFFRDFGEQLGGLEIRKGRNSSTDILLTNGSNILCVGAGGALTGRGADLLIIDDPIKSSDQAISQKYRDKLDDWFRSTAYTRIEPGGSCIIVMTRWHTDDLVGRIISSKERSAYFKQISLPALAEENDPLGRAVGQPLWPDRYSLAKIEEFQKLNGSAWFSSLYQQRPMPSNSRVFKLTDFGRYKITDGFYTIAKPSVETALTISPMDLRIYFTMDLAVAGTKESDKTVIIVFGVDNKSNIIILHTEIFPGNTSENRKRLIALNSKYSPVSIGIEKVSFQADFLDTMISKGLPAKPLIPRKGKYERALMMQPYVEAGKVYLPKEAVWLNEFEQQITFFPDTRHDDIVDAFTYIREFINSHRAAPVSAGKRKHLADGFVE